MSIKKEKNRKSLHVQNVERSIGGMGEHESSQKTQQENVKREMFE